MSFTSDSSTLVLSIKENNFLVELFLSKKMGIASFIQTDLCYSSVKYKVFY